MTQLSLLWPHGSPSETWPVSADTKRDLELDAVLAAISPHGPYRRLMAGIVTQLCLDPATIRYRQDVFADLEAHPQLAAAFQDALPLLDELAMFSGRHLGEATILHEVTARASELNLLIEAVYHLQQAFAAVDTPCQSRALTAFHDRVQEMAAGSDFQQLAANLPSLLSRLRTSASITIGVNLDHALRPEEALLLAVNDFRFTESSFLERLLGKDTAEGKGIAPLHKPPLINKGSGMIAAGLPAQGPPQQADPMLVPLFKDLSQILDKVVQPIAQELEKYVNLNSRFLVDLRPDIVFYVHSLAMIHKVQEAGLPCCRPQIAPAEDRLCQVKDAFNLQLAVSALLESSEQPLAERVVTNNIDLGENGRIAILTGPNQGGKTTYMQSVALIQVLAQLGLPVPGSWARISPVDAIYSHYPVEERLDLGTGRFGDEAQRIRAIFERVTRHSLVLFNESLATTSMSESVYLARDMVRTLRQIGCRAIYTTHLHDLASAADRINADTAGDSAVISLVASPQVGAENDDGRYSYRIEAGPPMGRSYAENIAARYGISREQLLRLLKARHLLP